MERSELEKCESSVEHGGRDEISKRRVEGEISKEWEWKSLQIRLRGWPREVPRETTWGQKKGFPACLFILIETNTKGTATFLSVVKLDKRKWLRSVFSSYGGGSWTSEPTLGINVRRVWLPAS